MKHGRSLIMALHAVGSFGGRKAMRPATGSTPGGTPSAELELRPIRPGAFAAWAARPTDGRPPHDVHRLDGVVARPRLLGRPPAV